MKKYLLFFPLICTMFTLSAVEPRVKVVNFNSCITDSKLGKQEQNAFETMRKQFVSLVEDTDKQLREVSEKLQDKDYLDGLSKEAEDAMKAKLSHLSEELGKYQQQYYQFANEGRYKIVQIVVNGIQHATEQMATIKGYDIVLNKEACFFYSPSLDITADIIKSMDHHFDEEAKKNLAGNTPQEGKK